MITTIFVSLLSLSSGSDQKIDQETLKKAEKAMKKCLDAINCEGKNADCLKSACCGAHYEQCKDVPFFQEACKCQEICSKKIVLPSIESIPELPPLYEDTTSAVDNETKEEEKDSIPQLPPLYEDTTPAVDNETKEEEKDSIPQLPPVEEETDSIPQLPPAEEEEEGEEDFISALPSTADIEKESLPQLPPIGKKGKGKGEKESISALPSSGDIKGEALPQLPPINEGEATTEAVEEYDNYPPLSKVDNSKDNISQSPSGTVTTNTEQQCNKPSLLEISNIGGELCGKLRNMTISLLLEEGANEQCIKTIENSFKCEPVTNTISRRLLMDKLENPDKSGKKAVKVRCPLPQKTDFKTFSRGLEQKLKEAGHDNCKVKATAPDIVENTSDTSGILQHDTIGQSMHLGKTELRDMIGGILESMENMEL